MAIILILSIIYILLLPFNQGRLYSLGFAFIILLLCILNNQILASTIWAINICVILFSFFRER